MSIQNEKNKNRTSLNKNDKELNYYLMQNRKNYFSSQQCSQARKIIFHATWNDEGQNYPGPRVLFGAFRCSFHATSETEAAFNLQLLFSK